MGEGEIAAAERPEKAGTNRPPGENASDVVDRGFGRFGVEIGRSGGGREAVRSRRQRRRQEEEGRQGKRRRENVDAESAASDQTISGRTPNPTQNRRRSYREEDEER